MRLTAFAPWVHDGRPAQFSWDPGKTHETVMPSLAKGLRMDLRIDGDCILGGAVNGSTGITGKMGQRGNEDQMAFGAEHMRPADAVAMP